ncbi:MAG: sigma-70 family RNA polymerase sigma factor [Terrimonas sp.]|nr:sigma-70 family RNA polymerase sigma factor [Terrimonas sp.]
MVPEQALIEQLKRGDEAAFKLIVEQWKDMVYNTSLGIVQNETEAEDITQDVFIRVFESISSFKGESKFSTWLYRIAVTKSLELLRSKKRKKRFAFLQPLLGNETADSLQPADFQHPGVALDNKERSVQLFKAIDKLPDNQKAAFILHKLEGISYKEVSEILGTTVPAVESLMNRAKNNLRKHLEEFYRSNR